MSRGPRSNGQGSNGQDLNGAAQTVGATLPPTGAASSGQQEIEVIDDFELLDPSTLLKVATSVGFTPATVKQTINNTSQAGSAWSNIATDTKFLGVDPEKLSRQRCYLIMLVLDDSGSMGGYEDAVVDAAKAFVKEYKDARESEKIHSDVLVAVGTLNGGLIIPYTDVRTFDGHLLDGFNADGGTPLFDVTNSALSLQMAKTTELALLGITSKTITVLMTDGCDGHSRLSSNEVRPVIKGLDNDGRMNHIVAGIYLGNADKSVFTSMGMKDEWILGSAQDAAKLVDTFSRLSKLSMMALSNGQGQADRAITMS